ncbi:MAG: RNA polymerase sigma factor [Flavipsychrobacter sp.]
MTDRQQTYGQRNPGIPGRDELPGLLQDCLVGRRSAQKTLYEAYAPFVLGIIKRYLYNQAGADEILNDAFFRIFTRIDQYAFKGSFEGWMRKIVINLVTDHLRQNIKHERIIHDKVEEYNVYVDDSVSKLSYKELLALIHQLPDTQKAVFNLYVFEDCSHKEIGEYLSITENNSRWYLNDARKRLKEKINNNM